MADESQYESAADSNKRRFDDTIALTTPSFDGGQKTSGFSSPDAAAGLPVCGIESAKQRAQEIASRLFNDAEAKRPKVDNGAFDSAPTMHSDQKPLATNVRVASTTSSLQDSYSYQGTNKKIDIPNGRVGVIIGKGGETIKYLQLQSGAKIQVTRDMDADPNSPTRTVELMGTLDQITKAEQLIREVLSEAETGGSAIVSRRLTGQAGSEQFSMKIPNNKVGLVIGKGGETIKNIQARSGARVQVIPLHLPPGDTSMERTVQIDGSAEQIEAAKQLVNEVTAENRLRNSSMGGGYPPQSYQVRAPTSWAPRPPQMQQQQQQPGYGYMQPGPYHVPQHSGSRPHFSGYPQQTGAGYPTNWDQTSAALQPPQGAGYDYYNQPPQQQQASGVAPSTDNSYYNYNQPPTSGYSSGHQGYTQDGGYGGGYSQPPPNPHQGYEQQQGYNNPTPSSGNTTKPPTDGQAPPPPQASPLGHQGYYMGQQPYTNPSYPTTGSSHPGYSTAPTSQPGYGDQPATQGGYATGYGEPPPPQAQKPPADMSAYGQPQQSPSQGYTNYQVQPPAHSVYVQPDPAAPRAPPPASYGATSTQPATYPAYGASPVTSTYGQQPPAYAGGSNGGPYAQALVYPVDGNGGAAGAVAGAAPPPVLPNVAAKAPPPEQK